MRSRFSLWLVINIFLFAVPNWAQDQWLAVRSPYFRLLTDGGEQRARETALAFEQLRSVFSQVLPQNTVDDSLPLLIVALRNAKELSEFAPLYKGKPVQSAGLCQTGPDGNAILFNLRVANRLQIV